jgi:hypothetical protein
VPQRVEICRIQFSTDVPLALAAAFRRVTVSAGLSPDCAGPTRSWRYSQRFVWSAGLPESSQKVPILPS